MLFNKHLALLAGFLAPALASNTTADAWLIIREDGSILEERAAKCVKGAHIVALGGGGTTKGDLGLFQSTADGVKGAIPHSQIFQIGYPPGAPSPDAIAYGTKHLNHHLRNYIHRCPKTKIITMGYSDGAAAVMDVLCGHVDDGKHPLPNKLKRHFAANVLYGDLTAVLGPSYMYGTCTSSDGVVPRAFPGKCAPYGKITRSYCDEGDPQCCGNGQGDPAPHFAYPGIYDSNVAKFAKKKFRKAKHHKKHHKHQHKHHHGKGGN